MTKFNPEDDLIVIPALLAAPPGEHQVPVILDTGANVSAFDSAYLKSIGIDPSTRAIDRYEVITASGYETYLVIALPMIEALGVRKKNMAVVCHEIPPNSGARGLLGLDFLRGRRLTIDMAKGTIRLK